MRQEAWARPGAWAIILFLTAAAWTMTPAAADDVCVNEPVGPFTVSGCVPLDECTSTGQDPEAEACVRPEECLEEDVGTASVRLCTVPRDQRDEDEDGYTPAQGDCDDEDPTAHPGAFEHPDGRDNDCDGVVDNGVDADLDGWTVEDGDCDDYNPDTYPGAPELLDGADNDCDGYVDEGV